jgi:hypothetical protein
MCMCTVVQLAGQEGLFVHCVMLFYLCHAICIPLVGMRGLLFFFLAYQNLCRSVLAYVHRHVD